MRLIPAEELRRVRQLLKRCETARCVAAVPVPGAATAAAVAPAAAPALAPAAVAWFDAAWCRAEAALKTPEGGAWRDAFDAASELGEARLRRLAGVLDREFLGGEMRRQLRLRGREKKAGGGGEGNPEVCSGEDASGRRGDGGIDGRKGGSLGFSIDDDDRGEADW